MIGCWLRSIVYLSRRSNSVGSWTWKRLCLTSLSVKSFDCGSKELKSFRDLFDFEGCRSLRIEICSWAWGHTIILFFIIVFIIIIKFGSWACWVSRFDTISSFAFAKLSAMSCSHFWVSHLSTLTVYLWGKYWRLFVFIYGNNFFIFSQVMSRSWSFDSRWCNGCSWIPSSHRSNGGLLIVLRWLPTYTFTWLT